MTFSVQELPETTKQEVTERSGKRLLVGRYCIYDKNRLCYVKKIKGDGTVDIIETITRSEHKVHYSEISMMETQGVNVFVLGKEPKIIKNSTFKFTINLKFNVKKDLTILHSIQ